MAAQHTIEEIGMLFAGLMILFAAPLTAKWFVGYACYVSVAPPPPPSCVVVLRTKEMAEEARVKKCGRNQMAMKFSCTHQHVCLYNNTKETHMRIQITCVANILKTITGQNINKMHSDKETSLQKEKLTTAIIKNNSFPFTPSSQIVRLASKLAILWKLEAAKNNSL